MKLGVIADDFTGATDIAGFLVENGLATLQFSGIPAKADLKGVDAVVISLKSRSCPADEAVHDSLAALDWLKARGCPRIYQKYCSTFDCTATGNIGPVTDALLAALESQFTLICPALPVNGRTVYQGNLFVGAQPLAESGMRHHPITPMTDSNLLRLMETQARGRAGLVPFSTIDKGAAAIAEAFEQLTQDGVRYAVVDTLTEQHLLDIAAAAIDMPLVTGGSGLAIGLARLLGKGNLAAAREAGRPLGTRAVVLSGSCSEMTNRQVARYQAIAPALALDVAACLTRADYPAELVRWVSSQPVTPAPMLHATTSPGELAAIQARHGRDAASEAVEQCFAQVAVLLREAGVESFIIAGGETSSRITQALGIAAFHIGPQIAPGVPWVRATDAPLSLALKSGNFGDETFFSRAQEFFHD
ncbi:3-oxo-tetronate kinase [Aeromonas salmonicida]|uniref:3-oxo-tetronate kinase n=1 Tax=Aeromonas salmonicida TaxID=645 RepID=UPI00073C002E|nr:3-oxo-tetronate kinase [Aeromonas salmonicida]KTA79166.1 membrane protein [Aeromonas salmonicida]MDE7527595.1 four-carbon acid sugar kinase family protein [Aeromonas salmonicida]MDE7531944.1 four-carbon acid sugar kinase family protein [Aeromonas salmonicida]